MFFVNRIEITNEWIKLLEPWKQDEDSKKEIEELTLFKKSVNLFFVNRMEITNEWIIPLEPRKQNENS